MVVTVVPSMRGADRFRLSVFTGLDTQEDFDGGSDYRAVASSGAAPTVTVERSEGRFVALHAALGDALRSAGRKGGSSGGAGGAGGIAGAAVGVATGAVGAAWGLGTGVASGVASGLGSGLGLFGAAPKAKATEKEDDSVVSALCQLPELPPLRSLGKDRSGVCRGLERYVIRLLELDDRWTDAGRHESFMGVAFGAKGQSAVSDPLPFLSAHRTLMEFLEDR